MNPIVGKGDLGYSFRMQAPRSLEEVDILLANQRLLKQAVGPEQAAVIEACPEKFSDADAFRIYHAKARFRATFTTIAASIVGCSVAAPFLGFSHGRQLMYHHRMLFVPACIGTWVVSY